TSRWMRASARRWPARCRAARAASARASEHRARGRRIVPDPSSRPGAASLAYIALGSNLDDPLSQVERGLAALASLSDSRLRARSAWYQSRAVGPGKQPDYINGVALLETSLAPEQLIVQLQAIEASQGRERRLRWAARTLDLDILLYGDRTIDSEQLQVPHPRLSERNFVLYPQAAIIPDLNTP